MFEPQYRNLAYVPRWTIVRTIRQQSVAEHMYFTALYTDQIYHYINKDCSLDQNQKFAVRHALLHDLNEVVSGDIPGPAKRAAISNRDGFEAALEKKVDKFLKTDYRTEYRQNLTHMSESFHHALSVVKAASGLDELMFMIEEKRLGNTTIDSVLEESEKRFFDYAERIGWPDNMSKQNFLGHVRGQIAAAKKLDPNTVFDYK